MSTRPRLRSASKKSIFARFFHARVLFFPLWSDPSPSGVTIPYRRTLEFANPYLASRTVSQQTSLTDFTPVDFRDPPRRPRRIQCPLFLSLSLLLCRAHRAPLQLPLSSANRFKSSGSHRHAHKTHRRKEEERRSGEREAEGRDEKEGGLRTQSETNFGRGRGDGVLVSFAAVNITIRV